MNRQGSSALIAKRRSYRRGGRNPIAFVCERTAEYVLIPALSEILSAKYKSVFPFWFWSTREGSSVADLPSRTRLVAVFARRPKVVIQGDREINVKFNSSVFKIAAVARAHGVPVLAGVPLISSLGDLAAKTSCMWFAVETADSTANIVTKRINWHDKVLIIESHGTLGDPVSPKEIVTHVDLIAESYDWSAAVDVLKKLRLPEDYQTPHLFFGLGTYRPFFFALLEEQSLG
jgi:hypothetical protein